MLIIFESLSHSALEMPFFFNDFSVITAVAFRMDNPVLKFNKTVTFKLKYVQCLGSLVGKNLTSLENLQNTEIKDVRWRLQMFVLRLVNTTTTVSSWQKVFSFKFQSLSRDGLVFQKKESKC